MGVIWEYGVWVFKVWSMCASMMKVLGIGYGCEVLGMGV